MMNLTNALLRKASELAERKMAVQIELTAAFVERYGVTYSDVDADKIIDTLDIHGGAITVAECDRIMTSCGHPPIVSTQR